MGPWDKKPQPSAGRLANHLEIHIENLSALALEGVETRDYRKNPEGEYIFAGGRKRQALQVTIRSCPDARAWARVTDRPTTTS